MCTIPRNSQLIAFEREYTYVAVIDEQACVFHFPWGSDKWLGVYRDSKFEWFLQSITPWRQKPLRISRELILRMEDKKEAFSPA